MRVAVRNVFDWIPTSLSVAALAARFDTDAELLGESGATLPGSGGRQGGVVTVVATKRHDSSYSPRAASAVGAFLARLPRRDSVALALARAAEDEQTGGRQVQYPTSRFTATAGTGERPGVARRRPGRVRSSVCWRR